MGLANKKDSLLSIHISKHPVSRPSLSWGALSLGAALLTAVAAAPAFAQGSTVTTTTPPAPNASSYTYQSGNSLPAGTATSAYSRPGADVATTRTTPPVLSARPLPYDPS